MINVIGGIYRERCLHPSWDHVFGSGGRAAIAIATMGTKVNLHAYISDNLLYDFNFKVALLEKDVFSLTRLPYYKDIIFNYSHGLDPLNPPIVEKKENIKLTSDNVLVFGMLECDFEINVDYAVYDPQNTFSTESFSKNGSKANHLALVLNENEAKTLCGCSDVNNIEEIIDVLHIQEAAEVIIVKCGPSGAIVSYEDKKTRIPAFKTNSVWKIGSGDCFTAHFANNWIENKELPDVAAYKASLATAFFCESSTLPSEFMLSDYNPKPIIFEGFSHKPVAYIASPFFTLPQLWLVEQIRFNLLEMGLDVISPYHDIGMLQSEDSKAFNKVCDADLTAIQRSDIVFGIIDGCDSGTIFEIGYATALKKKIILLNENVPLNDLVMFHNKHTVITNDYVTAIYKTLWANL
ncbi:PfkB family carbohydrate kinase [Pantoea agglomerans]